MISIRTIDTHNDLEFLSFLWLYREAIFEDVSLGNMTIDPSEWIDHPLRYWREKKTFDGYYVLIYRDAIVGYIKITQLYPHRCRLQHIFSVGPLYVHPEYRSLGYAKRLLGYSLQECLQNSGLSMINVNLAVNIHNIPAQKTLPFLWLFGDRYWEEFSPYRGGISRCDSYAEVSERERLLISNIFLSFFIFFISFSLFLAIFLLSYCSKYTFSTGIRPRVYFAHFPALCVAILFARLFV